MIDYTVSKIKYNDAKAYIKENHYSHGCSNSASPSYGLFDGDKLIGVLMFATPCSENVRRSVFGSSFSNHVTELHRLHILDCTPKNTESWFISRCLHLLKEDKPQVWAVLTFADSTVGHTGTIYKATNAYRIGMTDKRSFYIDQDGRLRHPRQCGVNITPVHAKEMGWTRVKRGAKYRYLWLLPDDKRHLKYIKDLCLLVS